MKKHTTQCIRCGRTQRENEGMWMLCQGCGTFQCPSCYGNILQASECPGCQDREERELIVEYLLQIKQEMEAEYGSGVRIKAA